MHTCNSGGSTGRHLQRQNAKSAASATASKKAQACSTAATAASAAADAASLAAGAAGIMFKKGPIYASYSPSLVVPSTVLGGQKFSAIYSSDLPCEIPRATNPCLKVSFLPHFLDNNWICKTLK